MYVQDTIKELCIQINDQLMPYGYSNHISSTAGGANMQLTSLGGVIRALAQVKVKQFRH